MRKSLLLSFTPHFEAILAKNQMGALLARISEELYLSIYDL